MVITELPEDFSSLAVSPSCAGKSSAASETKETPLDPRIARNLKSEFIDIVLNELDRLVSSSKPVKSISFPPNLSFDELAFLASTAKDYDCRLEFVHKGNMQFPKVIKNFVVPKTPES